MNYITAKQFLTIEKSIQDKIINWWQPQIGDLYCDINAHGQDWIGVIKDIDKLDVIKIDKKYDYYIPLLTESQLRHFAETKIGKQINKIVYDGFWGYCFFTEQENCLNVFYGVNGHDLLEAYWKLALTVSKRTCN